MNEDRQLLVGMDFGEFVTQISCYDNKIFEPVPIGRTDGANREYEIPTVIAVDIASGQWLYGKAAVNASAENYIKITNILEMAGKCDEFELDGYKFRTVEMVRRFMTNCLSILKEYSPNETIKKLVVSVEEKNDHLIKVIEEALKALGIESDRLIIQSHKQSYMYYAVSQPDELWMNNIGMFEYGKKGLTYSQISIDRKSVPYIVGAEKKDLSDVVPYQLVLEGDENKLKYAFINSANTSLHKQMVTTVYITGSGFEGRWSEDALKELCIGRRVFRGQNLFTKGACYAAREFAGEGKLDGFIFLDDDMIVSDIMIKTYHNAEVGEVALARAGTRWKDIDNSIDVIPDDEDEIEIIVRNVLEHEARAHILSLSGFSGRANRMTRFTIRIRFADRNTCIVTLKDNGFGEFCPSSNRIWERYIKI